jgi:hypothetical protein
MYTPITSNNDHAKFQTDLTNLEIWAKRWGMKFNPKKCYIMTVSREKPSTYFYTLCDCILDKVESCKYLGVNISHDLKWETHIAEVTSKGNQILGFLRRNLRNAPLKIKELAYFSLVRSTLEYSSIIWDPHYKKDINSVDKIQRQAARFVSSDYSWQSSVNDMIADLGWSALEDRRRRSRLTMFFKIVNGLVSIEPTTYLVAGAPQTRSNNSQKYMQIRTSTTSYQNSFFPRTIPEWNKLSQPTTQAKTVETFKNYLD